MPKNTLLQETFQPFLLWFMGASRLAKHIMPKEILSCLEVPYPDALNKTQMLRFFIACKNLNTIQRQILASPLKTLDASPLYQFFQYVAMQAHEFNDGYFQILTETKDPRVAAEALKIVHPVWHLSPEVLFNAFYTTDSPIDLANVLNFLINKYTNRCYQSIRLHLSSMIKAISAQRDRRQMDAVASALDHIVLSGFIGPIESFDEIAHFLSNAHDPYGCAQGLAAGRRKFGTVFISSILGLRIGNIDNFMQAVCYLAAIYELSDLDINECLAFHSIRDPLAVVKFLRSLRGRDRDRNFKNILARIPLDVADAAVLSMDRSDNPAIRLMFEHIIADSSPTTSNTIPFLIKNKDIIFSNKQPKALQSLLQYILDNFHQLMYSVKLKVHDVLHVQRYIEAVLHQDPQVVHKVLLLLRSYNSLHHFDFVIRQDDPLKHIDQIGIFLTHYSRINRCRDNADYIIQSDNPLMLARLCQLQENLHIDLLWIRILNNQPPPLFQKPDPLGLFNAMLPFFILKMEPETKILSWLADHPQPVHALLTLTEALRLLGGSSYDARIPASLLDCIDVIVQHPEEGDFWLAVLREALLKNPQTAVSLASVFKEITNRPTGLITLYTRAGFSEKDAKDLKLALITHAHSTRIETVGNSGLSNYSQIIASEGDNPFLDHHFGSIWTHPCRWQAVDFYYYLQKTGLEFLGEDKTFVYSLRLLTVNPILKLLNCSPNLKNWLQSVVNIKFFLQENAEYWPIYEDFYRYHLDTIPEAVKCLNFFVNRRRKPTPGALSITREIAERIFKLSALGFLEGRGGDVVLHNIFDEPWYKNLLEFFSLGSDAVLNKLSPEKIMAYHYLQIRTQEDPRFSTTQEGRIGKYVNAVMLGEESIREKLQRTNRQSILFFDPWTQALHPDYPKRKEIGKFAISFFAAMKHAPLPPIPTEIKDSILSYAILADSVGLGQLSTNL